MELLASDIYELYQPSRCDLRARLAKLETPPEGPEDAFATLLKELGKRHEEAHLRTFDAYVDLSEAATGMDFGGRHRETLAALRRREDVLYQPVLFGWRHRGTQDEDFILGIPDLLVREGDGYVVRDCKLARHVEGTHPEIALQLELYGWLYEQELGAPPVRIEAFLGDGTLKTLPYDGGVQAMAALDQIKAMAALADEPYEPVGWSKCAGCAYRPKCWHQAEQRQDIAVIVGVSQSLARQLHERGLGTYPALNDRGSVALLTQFVGVGEKTAQNVLRHVEARRSGSVLHLGRVLL